MRAIKGIRKWVREALGSNKGTPELMLEERANGSSGSISAIPVGELNQHLTHVVGTYPRSPKTISNTNRRDIPYFTPFPYQALETSATIRLVVIKHWINHPYGPLICDVQHVQLDNHQYNALSYEWGPSVEYDPIIKLGGCATVVRSNLYQALLRLRREWDDVSIWIDALSIDQSNTLERNHQVRLMGRIYNEASSVLIWLPGIEGFTEAVADVINHQDRGLSEESRGVLARVYPTILRMCCQTYWSRVWVQQEVYLAEQIFIFCDTASLYSPSETLDGVILDDMLGIITRDDGLDLREIAAQIEQSTANALVTRKRLPLHSSRLVTWLRLACHRGLETSEPRDLIYAMLGISSDCQDGGIEPDYGKPLIYVYLETIYFCDLHKPGPENKRFRKTLAEKLGLSWDSGMETRIQEYREQQATVRRED